MHAARSIQAIRCAEHPTAALRHGQVTSCASKFWVQHASPWVGHPGAKDIAAVQAVKAAIKAGFRVRRAIFNHMQT